MKKLNLVNICIIIGVICFVIIHQIWRNFSYDSGMQRFDKNYPELNYQLEVSTLLKQEGIRHKIDAEGILRFNHRHKEIVIYLYNNVSKKHKPDWPNIYWADTEIRENLISYLIENEIPYLIRKLDGKGSDYILWPPEYDDQVKSYNEKLLEIIKNSDKDI